MCKMHIYNIRNAAGKAITISFWVLANKLRIATFTPCEYVFLSVLGLEDGAWNGNAFKAQNYRGRANNMGKREANMYAYKHPIYSALYYNDLYCLYYQLTTDFRGTRFKQSYFSKNCIKYSIISVFIPNIFSNITYTGGEVKTENVCMHAILLRGL